jgi:DNA topoisomerase I
MLTSVYSLSHKELLRAGKDGQGAAQAASLRYVLDSAPGITRQRRGKEFVYLVGDKLLIQKKVLNRIKKLAIPPAWTGVWICPDENGHIQATGFDLRGRKQYRYHPQWSLLRNETKFHHLYEFGKTLPLLRARLEQDMAGPALTAQKVIATVIRVMEKTYIRIGSNEYEKMYGSYGLTTFKDKHLVVKGDKVQFIFKGKKGIEHHISLRHKKLARALKACQDIPGKELFQYYDEEGKRKSIDSGMVNSYIKEATNGDFTAKDFRTWAGSLEVLHAFCQLGEAADIKECKKKTLEAIDQVSLRLGNTRTVCRKYYIHPGLIRLYEENKLLAHLRELEQLNEEEEKAALTADEKVLMKILKKLVTTQTPAP